MSRMRVGQAIREVKTGKRWYVTACYPSGTVTAQQNQPQTHVGKVNPMERVFRPVEIERW